MNNGTYFNLRQPDKFFSHFSNRNSLVIVLFKDTPSKLLLLDEPIFTVFTYREWEMMELLPHFGGRFSESIISQSSFTGHGVWCHLRPFGYRILWWASYVHLGITTSYCSFSNAYYFPVGHISYSPWVEKWNCGILIRCPVNMANPCLDSYLYKRKSANIQNMVYLGCWDFSFRMLMNVPTIWVPSFKQ